MKLAVGAVIALVGAPLAGEAAEVPVDLQVSIVLKALAYDHNLEPRLSKEDPFRVGVLYVDGQNGSRALAEQVANALTTSPNRSINGHKLQARALPYLDAPTLRTTLATGGFRMLWVCTGLKGDLGAVRAMARELQITTVASQLSYVEAGLAMGVFLVEERPKIVVNRAATVAEGSAFGPELLQLAKILE